MNDTYLGELCLVAAIGAGLAGGVFFAFSTFVMAGLGKAPDRAGLESMQGINKAAPSPAFMVLLLGTAVLCIVLGVAASLRIGEPGATWQLIGCVAYLVTIVVTVVYHIPATTPSRCSTPPRPGRRRHGATTGPRGHAGTTCVRPPAQRPRCS